MDSDKKPTVDIPKDAREIIGKMNSPSKEDVALIEKAFDFAKRAHEGHQRYSGEPYFVHSYATAKNLAELQMDAKTITAGLLHDTLEDARLSRQVIEKEFGSEILFLIEGVTKLGKLKYRGAERHIESLRKLFVAMAQDIRVLIIKLTDRLHNMETLEYVPKEKQGRIALETLQVYMPLAYRLGMRKLTRELQDLAFPYVYPENYKKVKKILKEKSKETQDNLEKTLNSIKKELAKAGFTKFKTDYRIKGLYSTYQKLLRNEMDPDKIYDFSAIRIIVENEADCYKVLGIIHSNWRPLPGRIKDYIAFPKPNGYRSLHTTVFTGDGSIVEIQIRTEEMHREMEYGLAAHASYKEGFVKRFINPNLLWIAKLLLPRRGKAKTAEEKTNGNIPSWIKELAEEQLKTASHKEFVKNLEQDFFEERVFVFTPKGDVIDLPLHSSPVDFAYAVHSEIGDRMAGAKVNGKLVSLESELQNGYIVEIITKESARQSKKWLEFAKTAMAKRHIRNVLNAPSNK